MKKNKFNINQQVKLTNSLIGTIKEICAPGIYTIQYANGIRAMCKEEDLAIIDDKVRNLSVSLDTAKEWYEKNNELKEIALKLFTKEELTAHNLPATWAEYYLKLPAADIRKCDEELTAMPNNKYKALKKLEYLRNAYVNDWKPDWTICSQTKWVIERTNKILHITNRCYTHGFLNFPSPEMAQLFLDNFKELIEEADNLI